jgi:hypothetical protein
MPLTYSPPPGILCYCIAGKQTKTVTPSLRSFFAMPAFLQSRFSTENKSIADPAGQWPMVGHGDCRYREAAAVISFKSGSNAYTGMDEKNLSVTSGLLEKYDLKLHIS